MKGKVKEKALSFCLGHSTYRLRSQNCYNGKCQAISQYTKHRGMKLSGGPVGSPFHKKCRAIGGWPKLIEYFHKNRWEKTGICEFSKDESFISVFNRI